ncbi:uncharacterized protein LOC124274652 [Haliotis rubra]|uniref:uncharacterized protein LOC124274652 n=1 Tax=Haliotis rubra TaxID=36100 RepID=UPI001EE60D78|nr:uncharacterized protein LOC124274652 [Haliotis rubra]
MRLFLVLLLVALVLLPDSDAWRRRGRRWLRFRGRRLIDRVKGIYRFYLDHKATIDAVIASLGKRSIDDLDQNNDGNIDQSEAEELLERQAAEDLLSFADENGDSDVSVDEFSRSIDSFLTIDADPALREEHGEFNYI